VVGHFPDDVPIGDEIMLRAVLPNERGRTFHQRAVRELLDRHGRQGKCIDFGHRLSPSVSAVALKHAVQSLYHFTDKKNLESIRARGLLRAEHGTA
jgi:RNA:NAD 2'-phosphotransferase (TPT1/KptA family)